MFEDIIAILKKLHIKKVHSITQCVCHKAHIIHIRKARAATFPQSIISNKFLWITSQRARGTKSLPVEQGVNF